MIILSMSLSNKPAIQTIMAVERLGVTQGTTAKPKMSHVRKWNIESLMMTVQKWQNWHLLLRNWNYTVTKILRKSQDTTIMYLMTHMIITSPESSQVELSQGLSSHLATRTDSQTHMISYWSLSLMRISEDLIRYFPFHHWHPMILLFY